ncbi:YncE family protein [Salinimicrobium sediminilitoris]|uniref:YncE family protein n=1 Tax=Salinimicrobium sediminilitoris TaxID=2876715 RepID=UPI001E3C0808|nr:DUF5074 domain-containing protein [Salinimicrobium sediminilitoris]MCC8359170.1 hypothetical protein [Salinimicrobium sediminilitoris]
MQTRNYFYLIFILSILTSCEADDDSNPEPDNSGTYSEGFFVLNEGVFGQGNSSVSYVDPANEEISQNIFSGVNGVDLGDTASDLGFYEDRVFMVVNVSNKIEVVEDGTFLKMATIESNLENPRKIAFLDGMAYVTNWGDASNPLDDYVAVFNAETFEFITKITVEEGPENILAEGNRIFVAHKGGWNFNNTISVISGSDVEEVIEVGEVPNSLAAGNGFLWVSSSGLPNYAGETAGSISKIDLSTLEVVKRLKGANASWHPGNLTLENDLVYYTLGAEVYSFSTGEEILPLEPDFIMEEATNLYGFKLNDGRIYAASASPDYTGDGKLFIYDVATGNLQTTFDTGINPNGVFFNE